MLILFNILLSLFKSGLLVDQAGKIVFLLGCLWTGTAPYQEPDSTKKEENLYEDILDADI